MLAFEIPRAKKAAPRSSIFTCKSIKFLLAASLSAIVSGALRDPGEITKSLTPDSINCLINEWANLVESLKSSPPDKSD